MQFTPPAPDWQLAEVNIARLKAPVGDPLVQPFVDALGRVNAVADRMDGFVWRHVDESGNATETQVLGDPCVIYNASVWRDVASLERFVWGTIHARFYERREKWFTSMDSMGVAMWWVPPGTRFQPAEAMERLSELNCYGPSDRAFGWRQAPGAHLWKTGRCLPAATA
jgi:hypothetical protein